jgi:CBS domain containing-hemolysin-like protein
MEAAILAITAFAGASFFFALAETALFSLSKWQLSQLVEQDSRAGKIVAGLLAQPQDLLATLALGNTFANAAILAAALRMVFDSYWALALTMISMIALVLIGCEVLPKTLAVRRPEFWALRVAWPLFLFEKTSKPLHRVAIWINTHLLKKSVTQPSPMVLNQAEYQELLDMAFQEGTLGESEKEIILQIINLDRRTARDVMRPRATMACISDEATVEEMIATARKHRHRRLPMYDETPDTIVGILNTRLLLLDEKVDLADAIEFPSFVPESMNLLQLFRALQKQQRGLAMVIDEFGNTSGIVTMEDILVEIVGKIRFAVQPEGFVMERLAPGRWRLSGTMRLDDFRREYPGLAVVPEVETMGGLLTHLLGVVPDVGEQASFSGLKLTAKQTDGRRIQELTVQALKRAEHATP